MTSLVLEVRGRARPGKREEILKLFETRLAPRAETNEHQRLVVWTADEADDDAFVIFEIYDDRDAAAANASSDWFADYMVACAPLLEGEPTVMTGAARWVKGIEL